MYITNARVLCQHVCVLTVSIEATGNYRDLYCNKSKCKSHFCIVVETPKKGSEPVFCFISNGVTYLSHKKGTEQECINACYSPHCLGDYSHAR